jgi:hypothetical protein
MFDLGLPDHELLPQANLANLRDLAGWANRAWRGLVSGEIHWPEGEEFGWSVTFAWVVDYFDVAVRALIVRQSDRLPPGVTPADAKALSSMQLSSTKAKHRHDALEVMKYYTACLYTSFFLQRASDLNVPGLFHSSFEQQIHASTAQLHLKQTSIEDQAISGIVHHLVHEQLHFLQRYYSRSGAAWNQSGRPFASIRVTDLPLLASQDKIAATQYGRNEVERVFEQQLALVIQSLGFIAVPAKTGQRRADLICISNDGNASYSFLLDAKSSRAPYTLPMKDVRALIEYIRSLKAVSASLPAPSFVLIVGSTPAAGVSSRLKEIEVAAGLPVRFLTAADLTRLRLSLPGPVPARRFQSAIVEAVHVVPQIAITTLIDAWNREQKAHRDLIDALLAS